MVVIGVGVGVAFFVFTSFLGVIEATDSLLGEFICDIIGFGGRDLLSIVGLGCGVWLGDTFREFIGDKRLARDRRFIAFFTRLRLEVAVEEVPLE